MSEPLHHAPFGQPGQPPGVQTGPSVQPVVTGAVVRREPTADDIVASIGDISFSARTIHVPGRSFPMAGSIWTVRDNTMVTRQMPQWAWVGVIVGILFCGLGLFFLLVRETVVSGYIDVEVRNGSDYFVTQVPARNSLGTLGQVRQLVDYARSLSAWAQQHG